MTTLPTSRRTRVRKPNGRPPKPIAERTPTGGKLPHWQDVPTLLLAERLAAILPTCNTVEAVIALAVAKLAERTDD